MRLCVYGAGAIGGLLGARLAQKGEVDVTFIARGPHLAAMQADGVTLISGGEKITVRPRCVATAEEAGPQDYVLVTLKAHSLPEAAPRMQPLLGPETAIVSAVNGIPWWYFYKLAGPWEDRRVESVDPGGKLWDTLHPSRAIGCIVYPAAEVTAPGVIEHGYGDRFSLGEPDGSRSDPATGRGSDPPTCGHHSGGDPQERRHRLRPAHRRACGPGEYRGGRSGGRR